MNTTDDTLREEDNSTASSNKLPVFLIRSLIAIAWAVAFAVASDSATTGVTVGAGILLVLYPLIDVVGSLVDARNQQGSARRLLLANAVSSTVAAVALRVAATRGVAEVLAVFGVWRCSVAPPNSSSPSGAVSSSASSGRCGSPAVYRSSSGLP